MVYGRRRSSYRRKSSRGRRTLSTRNIYSNKGSRAQAAQISSLKRRINHVYRQCRPETKLKESQIRTVSIDMVSQQPWHLYTVDMPTPGTGDDGMIGNVCNIKDVHVYIDAELNMQYSNANYAIQGGLPGNLNYRIIAFCTKALTDNAPIVEDIIWLTSQPVNEGDYRLNTVHPFNEGVSAKYDIIYDRRFTVPQSMVSRKHHLRIKGSRIRKYITSEYMNFGKAQMYVLLIPVIQIPGVVTEGIPQLVNPQTVFRLMDKIAFTDP